MQNSLRECFQLEIQASTLGIFNFLKHFVKVKENNESNFDNLFYVGILVWVNSGSWWWTGRPGVLQSMGSKRVRHDWVSELNWTDFMWPNTARVLIQPAIDTKMMLIRSSHFFCDTESSNPVCVPPHGGWATFQASRGFMWPGAALLDSKDSGYLA